MLDKNGQVEDGRAGLPVPKPSSSFWLQDPSPILLGHRTTPELPETADIVIVGSGLTGSFAARFLKNREGSNESVVILEAREASSGATGRNGGHCQPEIYRSAPDVAAFELENYHFLRDLVKKHSIPCDWADKDGIVHSFFSPDLWEEALAAVEKTRKSHPELGTQLEVVHPPSATNNPPGSNHTLAGLRIPHAHGAVIQKHGATLWPYKLVAWVLEQLLSAFPAPAFNLQTNTPVTALTRTPSSPYQWTLTTPRGPIAARQVLLATNGHTSHLLPAFADLIVPVRGQLGAYRPPEPSRPPSPMTLHHSYGFDSSALDPGGPRGEYLGQRPGPGGDLIYGGGRRRARNLAVGEWRDDEVEEVVAGYLRRSLLEVFDLRPSTEARGLGELEPTFEWTGVMAYSRDRRSWVGAVPEGLGGGEGLFVSAGYTGHGMPHAALSARAVVEVMVGVGNPGVGLPGGYWVSEERVRVVRETEESVVERRDHGGGGDVPKVIAP
ncbi:FAD dependent oxidoreductase [Lasiosphaeria hispida]|uniref:FAD dependent oxidoreductase n=1 Tax=Lasiosphaeria hispida TaxID=260671 RepID=A0AAJ0HS59_9PEZI|nr:FAD dependent oxidoreductase [Lasiosphaeria hispida]